MKFILISILLVSCIEKKFPPKNPEIDSLSCIYKLKKFDQCLSINWEVLPTEEDFGQFQINLNPKIDYDGELSAFLWMPSMGHGSSPITITQVNEGTYLASEVFFSMHGNWEIHFQIRKNNEVIDQAIIPYSY